MSYSEWISSYTTGGYGSKNLNNMVQESSGSVSDSNDSQGLAVYSILYGENYGLMSGNSTKDEAKATIIEIDEAEPGEDENRLTFLYEPSNEMLSCVETPSPNQNTLGNMSIANSLFDQQSILQFWQDKTKSFDSGKLVPYCKKQSCNFEQDYFSTLDRSQKESITGFSLCSKQRNSWSDESNGDGYEYNQNFFCQYGRASFQNACSRVPTYMSINLENLKHVFVDVHRSMSCSFEDGCAVCYRPQSNSSEIFDDNTTMDNEKTGSYFTIRSHYICCCGTHAVPKMDDQLFICSLHQLSKRRHRRYSV